MPLTEEQRKVLPALRAHFSSIEIPLGSPTPFDKRVHLPTNDLPDDITARVAIAPPLSTSFPSLDSSALKKSEPVPVFHYSLRNEDSARTVESKAIFFIHGGGNLAGHPTDAHYLHLFATILRGVATESGGSVSCTVIAPCYRLATVPENAFPAALQDILAAYDFVIGQGHRPSDVILAGDSSGGNHAVVLTHLAIQSHRPLPSGVFVLAPAAIQVYDGRSEHAQAQASVDLLPLSTYQLGTTHYIANTGFAPTDPLVSGCFITFTELWPRTLILAGTGDQLIDSSRELETRLTRLGRPVELVEYDELPHGWWLLPSVFPEENQVAAQRISRFVIGQIQGLEHV